jgi:hypothetical protein
LAWFFGSNTWLKVSAQAVMQIVVVRRGCF